MALRQTKKISELPPLSPASLDTTFVVGISGSTTYKISINQLTSSLDTTFATDLVTATLSGSLDGKLTTSSFNSYTASISTASLVTSISNLNTFTASVSTASLVTSITNINNATSSYELKGSDILSGSISYTSLTNIPQGIVSQSTDLSSLNTFTASVSTASLVTSISNLNTFTSSQSTSSLVDRLNTIESVSSSWITESETGSFLTSLNGAISSSSQITTLLPTGVVSGSAQTITNLPTGVISGSSQLTTSFPSKTTGNWTVPAGASIQSFTVEGGHTYSMWVNGNIPNGIIIWNATVTTSNTNVPVVGFQYGWYYTAGNELVLTSMPDQITGTNGSIVNTPASYAPNTSNVFKFGITNNSGASQTINYGYIKLS